MNKLVCLLFIAVCWGCTHSTETEKYQNKRNKVVNVHNKIKEIVIPEDDVLIGAFANLYVMDDYLIVKDNKSFDKLIHLFDLNDADIQFAYLELDGLIQ
jgi:hypothetical protein